MANCLHFIIKSHIRTNNTYSASNRNRMCYSLLVKGSRRLNVSDQVRVLDIMKTLKIFILCFLFVPAIIIGNVFEDLSKQGYAVIDTTNVTGTFNGCEYDRVYKLDNGKLFYCGGYNYNYSYRPELYILKNVKNSNYKYIIDDEEYEGEVR